MRLRLLALLAALVSLSSCDFTPTLNIDLPEYEPATVINAVLAVDSVATVRLGVSTDPYVLGGFEDYTTVPGGYVSQPGRVTEGTVVTLLRDGQPVERLAFRARICQEFGYRSSGLETYDCGPFVGTVPVEAGGRYTIRAEVPGRPTAEGTVTMPRRPTITAEEIGDVGDEDRQFRVSVQDPAGLGDRYGISLLRARRQQTSPICDNGTDSSMCRDTTIVVPREPRGFTSSDPVLLAAARDLNLRNNSFGFISVTDAAFDGRTWAFTITAPSIYFGDGSQINNETHTVQIAALSSDVYDAYQISTFGGQDTENPFIEPVNLPTNVTGGYGLVGGVALAEVTFERMDTRRLGGLARR